MGGYSEKRGLRSSPTPGASSFPADRAWEVSLAPHSGAGGASWVLEQCRPLFSPSSAGIYGTRMVAL